MSGNVTIYRHGTIPPSQVVSYWRWTKLVEQFYCGIGTYFTVLKSSFFIYYRCEIEKGTKPQVKYNQKSKLTKVKIGEAVLLESLRIPNKKEITKFLPLWEGPYKAMEIKGLGSYVIGHNGNFTLKVWRDIKRIASSNFISND